jgi:hypothetical protein
MCQDNDLYAGSTSSREGRALQLSPEDEARKNLAVHIRDKSPFELCLVGGNHLASALIGALGPGFSERFPQNADHREVYTKIGGTLIYDIWCCWSLMGIARDIHEAISQGQIEEAQRADEGDATQ